MNSLRAKEWLIMGLLFVGMSSIYYATTSGITSSNDGSHYALVRTMVQNRAFTLNEFDDYAEGNDIAITDDGRLFSDRPPGTALLTTLFYSVGRWIPYPGTPLPSRHDADNPALLFVMLLPALAGAGTLVVLYQWLRDLEISRSGALLAAIMLGLGTAHWKYSSVLFSHALSAFVVMLSLFFATRLRQNRQAGWWQYAGLGLLLGFSVLVEYSNGLLVVVVGLYLLIGQRPLPPKRLSQTILPFAAAGLIPAAFLAYYNSVNFGSPTTLSYAFAINYPWAGEFSTTFSTPLLEGLRTLLFWGAGGGWCNPTCFNQGLFLLSPVLLLALPGIYLFVRRAGWKSALPLLIFLIYLALFAKHFTSHGFTGDGRYLIPFFGLLALPLGFTLDKVLSWNATPLRQTLSWLLIYALFFLSLRNIFLHIGFSYNYNLDLSQLDNLIVRPTNWRYLFGQIFRNRVNLPLLWLWEIVGIVAISSLKRILSQRTLLA